GLRANYIFAYARGANTSATIDPKAFGIAGPAYLYDYLHGTGSLIGANSTWTADLSTAPGYFVLMPVGRTGIAFLGDKGHFVTLGKQRIASLGDDGRVDLTVSFAAGEKTRTLFGYSPQPVIVTTPAGSQGGLGWNSSTQLFTVNVHPSSAGIAHVRIVQSF